MNYTENYHLPQWEETDRIMRTDFNQMCADIEEGLTQSYSPENPLYVVGTYMGDGGYQIIQLDFTPRAVLIAQGYNGTDTAEDAIARCTLLTKQSTGVAGGIDENSFHVIALKKYPSINNRLGVYVYIAFR